MNARDHHAQVRAFLAECAQEDHDRFAEVCRNHPVLSPRQWRTVRKKEICVGLLGLQPARISRDEARRYGLDSDYDEEE